MNVEVARLTELGPLQLARWAALQQAATVYRSPFFRPEFATAVSRVRDVRVAVIQQAGSTIGFLPFETGRGAHGYPVGRPFSDYHGVVLAADVAVDARDLVRTCGLVTWSFDHVPAELTAFVPHAHGRGHSPCLDLSAGFDAYLSTRQARSEVQGVRRKARKLAREVGPLRLELDSRDRDLLERLLGWKRRQYAETGVRDVLADSRGADLLRHVHATRSPGFAGMLSVLRAGDVVAAIHLGLRSGGVWHSWFPAYDPRLARYSPGLVLLLELAAAAPAAGLHELDLGKGEARYKEALATGSVALVDGCVGASTVSALAMTARLSARRGLRRIGVHRALRRALRSGRG